MFYSCPMIEFRDFPPSSYRYRHDDSVVAAHSHPFSADGFTAGCVMTAVGDTDRATLLNHYNTHTNGRTSVNHMEN